MVPIFDLPDPPAYSLEKAPLAQALAQVRFPLIAGFETMAGISPLQELLRGRFPYMEQLRTQELSLVVGPGGPASDTSESVSWSLTNDDGYSFTVGAGSASLSVGEAYTDVSDFAAAFEFVLAGLAKVGVPRCDRIGVRYLSLAPDLPGKPGSWRHWFKPELLGWVGTSVVPVEALSHSIAQAYVSVPPRDDLAGCVGDVQVAVRNGFVPAGTSVPGVPPLSVTEPSYLLDIDVFAVGHQAFDGGTLLEQFKILHAQIDRFFFWSLTEHGGEHFGLETGDS